jgi:polyisoprenoid-binding protein YceI
MLRVFAGFLFCVLVAACGQGPAAPAAAGPATPGAWVIDEEQSRIAFSGTQSGKVFEGEFRNFAVTVVLDPTDLSGATIEAEIDVASARTGDRQRDDALPSADWFNARVFPTATFRSEDVTATGEGAYLARGLLSIRGVERPLDLPFTLAIAGDAATARAEATLMRGDFGVGQGEFSTDEWVGFEVKVSISLVASR